MMRSPLVRMAATTATLVPCHSSFRFSSPEWALNLSPWTGQVWEWELCHLRVPRQPPPPRCHTLICTLRAWWEVPRVIQPACEGTQWSRNRVMASRIHDGGSAAHLPFSFYFPDVL